MPPSLRSYILLLFCCIFIIPPIKAQKFQMSLLAGINLSELAGEEITSNVGIHTGISGTVLFNKQWQISTEFLYSQAGEYVLPIAYPNINFGKTNLAYLEIPFYISRLAFPKDNFYQKTFGIGFAYTRLIGFSIENSLGIDISDQIEWADKTAFIGLFCVGHRFDSHFGLDFRAALGHNSAQWAWTLSLRGSYTLF